MRPVRFTVLAVSFLVFSTISVHGQNPEDRKVMTRPNAGPLDAGPTKKMGQVATRLPVVSKPPDEDAAAPPKHKDGPSRRRPTSYKALEVKSGATLSGTIRYAGKLPPAKKIQVVKDQATCDHRPKEEQLVKVDEKGRVAEAVVFLADIKEGKAFEKREKPPLINQQTCTFEPHVQAVRVGEPVDILNSDPVAHNIQANQRVYTLFNVLQPLQNMRASQRFERPGVVDLKCNVHDWMHAYLHVFAHPYYSVTGPDGEFKLTNVPPGKHELIVWQEHLGEQSFDVEIKPAEDQRLAITLEPKAGEDADK